MSQGRHSTNTDIYAEFCLKLHIQPDITTSSSHTLLIPSQIQESQWSSLERAKVVNVSISPPVIGILPDSLLSCLSSSQLLQQLQIWLQYARLKGEHGWQRQFLNEVENLYFCHSTLKGKSKAPALSSSSSAHPSSSLCPTISLPLTASGPSPKATSASSQTTKGAKVAPEANQAAAPPVPAPLPLPTIFVSSPLPAAVAIMSPHESPPSQLSTPAKSTLLYCHHVGHADA
ncbi:hypothetical protein F5148DRAFT_1290798 [Russula earlei]|uniref:Uncharacterized protein n=1 Tax=Russula earlei TaxID=71964 RepID=A0ACC0TX16_9AGAM|nr:hypothetical protein F5148DRAFT_1290798 [Russula earlei]